MACMYKNDVVEHSCVIVNVYLICKQDALTVTAYLVATYFNMK